MPPETRTVAEDQIRGKRLDLGGLFSREGDAAATIFIHESTPGAEDAFFQVDGDAVIVGNLTVKGVLTSIESIIVQVADKNMTLNFGGDDASADGAGLTIDRTTSPLPSLIWSETRQAWSAGLVGAEESIQGFVHTQGAASDNWVISHGMNKRPAVSVVDGTDTVVIADVIYVDENNIAINFTAATTGKAYLN